MVVTAATAYIASPLIPVAVKNGVGTCRMTVYNPRFQTSALEFISSALPGTPEISAAGTAGFIFGDIYSPSEWFR